MSSLAASWARRRRNTERQRTPAPGRPCFKIPTGADACHCLQSKAGQGWRQVVSCSAMTTIQLEQFIHAPTQAVYDYVTRPALWKEWHPASLGAQEHAAESLAA